MISAVLAHDLGWRVLAVVLLAGLACGMAGISQAGQNRP